MIEPPQQLTPMALVLSRYTFPFEARPHQVSTVNELAPLPRQGHFLDPGCGKTLTGTAAALLKKIQGCDHTLVIMPPTLLRQWEAWLNLIQPRLKVARYQGTPSDRKAMSLNADFILVGAQIFKKEFHKFFEFFADRQVFTIVDEATMLCNISSDTHQKVYDFTAGREVAALTGTPASDIPGVYGIMKFTAPGIYRNMHQFERLHVESLDLFGKPTTFCNLELLRANLATNSKRILIEEVAKELADVTYTPLVYDLDPAHYKLYRKLANEELLKLEDGGKIDATTETRLVHALGQIVCNPEHFSGGSIQKAAGMDVVQEYLDELGDGKLVVAANYKMTLNALVEKFKKYHPVAIFGGIPQKQRDKAVLTFVNDPRCRLMIINPTAAGLGIDGIQHAAHHMLFLEPTASPRLFYQTIARLKRLGQKLPVFVKIAMANKTLQQKRFESLLNNDDVMVQVIHTISDLRSAIFGE